MFYPDSLRRRAFLIVYDALKIDWDLIASQNWSTGMSPETDSNILPISLCLTESSKIAQVNNSPGNSSP